MFLPLTIRFATPSISSTSPSFSSSPPLVPFRGSYSRAFLSLAYRFSVCPCVQWSAKYHLLRVCLTAFLLTLHLFELPFLLKNFIDFILFFPLAFYFPYLLVLCLRMACDVMNMLFLDFF